MSKQQDLQKKTKPQLLALARELELRGYSRMRKTELIKAIANAQPAAPKAAERSNVTSAPVAGIAAPIVTESALDAVEQLERTPGQPSSAAMARAERPAIDTPSATPRIHPIAAVGAKYTTGDRPEPALDADADADDEPIDLPEHYGTRRIFLTARDPRWMHAYWDFTDEQLESGRAASADGIHRLRLLSEDSPRRIAEEVTLPPGAHSWYFHTDRPGGRFSVHLGYLDAEDRFLEMGSSNIAQAPDEVPQKDLDEEFISIPVDVPFQVMRGDTPDAGAPADEPTADEPAAADQGERGAAPEASTPGPEQGQVETPAPAPEAKAPNRPADDPPPLQELVARAGVAVPAPQEQPPEFAPAPRRSAATSAGVAPGGAPEPGAAPWDQQAQPSSWARPIGASWSQPASWAEHAVRPEARAFRMRVNAEVKIYGDTVPGSRVTLEGRPVPIDANGAFSFRYALPDGQYQLKIEATSPDEKETRSALIDMARGTATIGEVGEHPLPVRLTPPPAPRSSDR